MLTPIKSSDFIRRGLAVTAGLAMLLGGGAVMQAQSTVSAPAVNFKAYTAPNFALNADADGVSSSSSSSSSADYIASVTNVNPLHLNAMQYGRRRYGRPRYRGGNTNADGSNKWIFYGGGGLVQPVGNTYHYFTPFWGVQVGGGRQFSSHFAVPIEFDYDALDLTRQTLANQSYIYFSDYSPQDNGMDANAHIWSFSVDPTYTLFGGTTADGLGAYVVGDVGFYHKVTNFTVPEEEEYCDYYYGYCGDVEVQGTFDHYTSNAPGFGGGFGLTYKVSHFSNTHLYAEIRYIFMDDSQRTGYTAADAAANVPYTGSNYFPANSNRTTYVPVKFGIRF
jgi:hypothetical protein